MSSLSSNTTARPVCLSSAGVAADGLITAPSGLRLPRSTAMPAWGLNGSSNAWMTSRFQFGASLQLSHSVLPLTVSASRFSSGPSSRITAGRPPA
jgi:hypothetical protein